MEYILLAIAAILLFRKKNIIAFYDWWTDTLTPIRKTFFTAGARRVTVRIYNADVEGPIIVYQTLYGIDVIVEIGPHETKEIFLSANGKLDGATYANNAEAKIFFITTFTP